LPLQKQDISALLYICLSWITPEIQTDPDEIFTREGWRRLRWDASMETVGALGQGPPNWFRKKNFFVRKIRSPKCHFSAADLREIWRPHVNQCSHNLFYWKCEIFRKRGHLPQPLSTSDRCYTGKLWHLLRARIVAELKLTYLKVTNQIVQKKW